MLTRIEIDGFKTFRDFSLDVPPFLVILGRNAAGKSNIFDALLFLGLIADESILEAARRTRGDVAELFHRQSDGTRLNRMRFGVEVLLDRHVTDAFGDRSRVSHSRVRYDVSIELRETSSGERPFVYNESVSLIRRDTDSWMKQFAPSMRRALATYSSRSSADLLKTDATDPTRLRFRIFQERSQGRPRELPANEATATVLSSLTTANEFPLLYALKRELQSWRLLHLDPTALRDPDSYDDPDAISPNGAHLANTLRRIGRETETPDRPNGALNDLIADVSAVIPEVVDLRIRDDETRRQRYVEVVTRGEAPYSARVASDGTLRAIALLAALYDPRGSGLICFEEPENGIYPHRLAQFVRHLRNLTIESFERRLDSPESRITQLLLSSHSPAILKALQPMRDDTTRGDVVFIDMSSRSRRSEPTSRISRVRRVQPGGHQLSAFEIGTIVSPAEIAEFEVSQELGS